MERVTNKRGRRREVPERTSEEYKDAGTASEGDRETQGHRPRVGEGPVETTTSVQWFRGEENRRGE